MSCSACSAHVEKSVSKVDGVDKVMVNLLTNSMQVEFQEEKTNTAAIIKAVEKAGYGASVKGKTAEKASGETDAGIGTAEKHRKHEKAIDHFCYFSCAVNVCFDGTYDL